MPSVLKLAALLVPIATAPLILNAQALPTASRLFSAQAGGGISLNSPDYSTGHNKGITVYADLDIGKHLGVEFDYHNVSIWTPNDIGEVTILAGVRYGFDYRRFRPYAKLLAGRGTFQFQQGSYAPTASSYLALAFGGGVDYHLKRKINLRLSDFEYQHWNYGSGLTPWVYTVGAAYQF
jgi:hypothetical protein